MATILGIDLGTTYSVISIPEERRGARFRQVAGIPGYSVILDEHKRALIPSVVGEKDGRLVVGHAAKDLAGAWPAPIGFSKRDLGIDTRYALDRLGSLSPEDVSMHVLIYLKRIATEALQEEVEAAVITVPAHFKDQAITMTRRATERAGLRVARLVQEPVAAALMYSLSVAAESLRVMTYDLGGGTFDAALLEKRDGVLSDDSIQAFEGDKHLGGYDFDSKLAHWIVSKLVAGNKHSFPQDLSSDPEIHAALMVIAEQVKKQLGSAESYEIDFSKQIRSDDESRAIDFTRHPLKDSNGTPVSSVVRITRKEFEQLIGEEVEKTFRVCREVMRQKLRKDASTDDRKRQVDLLSPAEVDKILAEQVDEIILVGGSSRLPLIARRARELYGKQARLVEPDLCVALGAAIVARTFPAEDGCLVLNFVPPESALPHVTVSGQVIPHPSLHAVQGCAVTLSTPGNDPLECRVGGDGKFLFDRVELQPETATEFSLEVRTPDGVMVKDKRFTVRQTGAGGLLPPQNRVVNPIAVLFVEGLHVVAEKLTLLPHEKIIEGRTADNSGEIRLSIYQAYIQIGELRMTDVPRDLAVGTPIEITINIGADFQIRAKARIPSIDREVATTIQIATPALLDREDLKRRLHKLKAEADDARRAADPDDLLRFVTQLNDLLTEADAILAQPSVDRSRVQDRLERIEGLVARLRPWSPNPSRLVFDEQVAEARRLYASARLRRPEVSAMGYEVRLEEIKTSADAAFMNRDRGLWIAGWTDLLRLVETLGSLLRPEGQPAPPADPKYLKQQCERDLIELKRRTRDFDETSARVEMDKQSVNATRELIDVWIRNRGLLAKFRERFDVLQNEIAACDPAAPNAETRIYAWHARLEALDKDIDRERYSLIGVPRGPAGSA